MPVVMRAKDTTRAGRVGGEGWGRVAVLGAVGTEGQVN